jgi:hypothetical protein
MKTARLNIIATAAALVLTAGMFFNVPAGQRVHRAVTRDAEVTSVPAPFVDDSPINPDTAGKIKIRSDSRNDKPINKLPKRRMSRR